MRSARASRNLPGARGRRFAAMALVRHFCARRMFGAQLTSADLVSWDTSRHSRQTHCEGLQAGGADRISFLAGATPQLPKAVAAHAQ